MRDILTSNERVVIKAMAEHAVTIPKGGRVGRWTREDRIAVVYSALCGLFRIAKRKKNNHERSKVA